MKKILIAVLLCLTFLGCSKQEKFYLDDKYYNNEENVKIDNKELEKLIKDKSNFALFVYLEGCTSCEDFRKVLDAFRDETKISFYEITFGDMKKTNLSKKIKYSPSIVIYKDGKVIAYLDATSDNDMMYYKNKTEFKNWFSNYVILK